jgi:carbon storage regulator
MASARKNRHTLCIFTSRLAHGVQHHLLSVAGTIAMLVLSRKPGEKIVIGDNIVVTVVAVVNNRVKLSLEAPADVPIWRSELLGLEQTVGDRPAHSAGWKGRGPVPDVVVHH